PIEGGNPGDGVNRSPLTAVCARQDRSLGSSSRGGPMPAERLPMRKVREVLRQRYACGASERLIAQSLGIGRTAVGEYIRRAAVVGITWPVPDELDDAALERKLFAPAGYNPPQ